jgi:hypothetical protein
MKNENIFMASKRCRMVYKMDLECTGSILNKVSHIQLMLGIEAEMLLEEL